MSEILLPVFFLEVYGLSLTFKFLIYFESILVYGIKRWSSFIFFLHVFVQFSEHHVLNRLSLPYGMFLPPLSNIN